MAMIVRARAERDKALEDLCLLRAEHQKLREERDQLRAFVDDGGRI